MDTNYQIHLNRIKKKDIYLSIENKNERTKGKSKVCSKFKER